MTKATANQVRKSYKDQGYDVRIRDDNGHVEIREDFGSGNYGEWLEGRYIDEYRVIDGQIVLS
jgi:hypothetical protein